MGINIDDLVVEYFEDTHIIHITTKNKLVGKSKEECFDILYAFKDLVLEKLGEKKGYIIADYNKIIIQLENIDEYAEELYAMLSKSIYRGGYARYGHSITRITAMRISDHMSDESPPLFHSKKEAFDYIYTIIERNSLEMKS
ncbi:MAG: hypothetical protein KAR42_16515 [candidate division Zixibacteria bacterium]|nr:hypothetical protein [candidate division Zixibacteria bacterium]